MTQTLEQRIKKFSHNYIQALFPFELAQGDCGKRTQPEANICLNTGAAWMVSQDGKSAHKVREALEIVNDMQGLIKDLAEQRDLISKENYEIDQILGKALGYPAAYPQVSDVDNGAVVTGEHIPVTLAQEAAAKIRQLTEQREVLIKALQVYACGQWKGYVCYTKYILPPDRPLTQEEYDIGRMEERLIAEEKFDQGALAEEALKQVEDK